jgi:hypothetical protein
MLMPRTLLAVVLCLALAPSASAQTQEPASSGTPAPDQPATRGERLSAETKNALLGFGIGAIGGVMFGSTVLCIDTHGCGNGIATGVLIFSGVGALIGKVMAAKADSANSRMHVRRVAVSPAVSKSAVGARWP